MKRFTFILIPLFYTFAGIYAQTQQIDSLEIVLKYSNETPGTDLYHQLAMHYSELGSTIGTAKAIIYETEALLWEYYHDQDEIDVANLLYNLAYYYSGIACYNKAALLSNKALNFYSQIEDLDSAIIENAEELKYYCDSMAQYYYSYEYTYDSVRYADVPSSEDSIISRTNSFITAVYYLKFFDEKAYQSSEIQDVLPLLEKRSDHNHTIDFTLEKRLQSYFSFILDSRGKSYCAKNLIYYAKLYIENCPKDKQHASLLPIVYDCLENAVSLCEEEQEILPFLHAHELHKTYTNVLFNYANRIKQNGEEKKARILKQQAWQYAKKHKALHCSSCMKEVNNEALPFMVENDFKTAAKVYKKAFSDTIDAPMKVLLHAMIAYYRAGMFDKGWEIDQCVEEYDPNKDEYTYIWDGENMWYDFKHKIVMLGGTIENLNVDGIKLELHHSHVDTMRITNVDLKIDSAASSHVEAQVYAGGAVFGKEHINASYTNSTSRYLTDVAALTQYLINQGNYEDAEKWCKNAYDAVTYLGDRLPKLYFAQTCYYMALIFAHKGEWKQVLDYLNAALPYYIDNEDDEMIALFFTLGSQYYQHFYQYATAVERAETACSAFQNIPNEQWNTDKLVNVFLNCATCYLQSGAYSSGLGLMLELLDYVEEHQGRTHINYGKILMQMLTYPDIIYANVQSKVQAFFEAERIYANHADLLLQTNRMARIFGKNYIDLYTIGANLFAEMGNDSLALKSSENAISYILDIYGDEHPYVIPPVLQQAQAYLATGNVKSALHNLKFIRLVAANAYGPYHWIVGDIQWQIAQCELADNNIVAFELYADSVIHNFKHNIRNEFTFLTSNQRALYWEHQNRILESLSTYASQIQTPKMQQLLYDIALLTKGMLLKTETDISDIISQSGDTILEQQYLSLLQLNEQQRLAKEQGLPFTKDQEHEKETLEKRIMQKVLKYGDYTQSMTIEWKQVFKALSKNQVAIEYMTVPLNEDSTIYCALLLRKNSKYPELIPLFEEKEALALISPDEDETYNYKENGKKLFQVVWSKLLPSLKTGETIYFAASGLLHQLAIEALPYDEKHVMSDLYNLVRVSSTRELVLNKNDYKNTTATLYGGIQYAMDTTLIKTESGKYQNLAVNRGLDNDTLDRGKIRFLPGTKAEVEEINRLLKENNLQVQLFTATNANEESFKALSGKHQNILQIATHGFYWTDSTARKKDYFSQRILTLGNDMPSPPAIDPLNRCGLLFAGAQMAWSGQSADLPEGVQDGILTAKEISLLDLRDANLVVLSACETGKGEITGEGVFGLQRAFKQAGAQTIIMTLWPVNDQATRLFMTEFYHNWITNKQSKREAFRNAQNTVRAQYEEPTYWAGFIMLD